MLLVLHGHSPAHRRVPAAGTPFCSAASLQMSIRIHPHCGKKSFKRSKELLLFPTPLSATHLPSCPLFHTPETQSGLLVLTYHLPLRGFMDTKAQRLNYLHKRKEYTSSLSVPMISHSFFPSLLHIKTVRVDGVDENRISFP